jgi:hypothetical protein
MALSIYLSLSLSLSLSLVSGMVLRKGVDLQCVKDAFVKANRGPIEGTLVKVEGLIRCQV